MFKSSNQNIALIAVALSGLIWGILWIPLRTLHNGLKQYKRSLETFDHMMEFAAEKEGDLSESIYKDGIAAFKREVLWILDMLAYIDEPDEYNSAISKIETDLKERGHGQLYSEICETSPNKQRQ